MSTKRSLEGEEVPTQEGAQKKTKIEGEEESTETLELVETRILIENHEAGTIIGKGGSNVIKIRQDSKAFVSILKNESQTSKERVLVLKGTTDYNAEAIRLICDLLVEAQVHRKQKLADEQGVENTSTPPPAQMKMLVHKLYAGAIIGKGGEIIKGIKADTGANISLSVDPLTGSSEKTVTVSGTTEQVHAACSRVLEQIKNNPLRGSATSIPYQPGAAVLQAQQHAYNPYGQPPMGYGAPPPNQMYGQAPAPPTSSFGAPQGMQGGMGYGAPPQQQQPGATKTEKIVIPTVCAGSVIGKGGSIIREIKSQSGANINIANPAPTAPGDRVVTVTGTSQAIQTAIYLIRQRVESYAPPANANAPGGYGGY